MKSLNSSLPVYLVDSLDLSWIELVLVCHNESDGDDDGHVNGSRSLYRSMEFANVSLHFVSRL